MSLLTDAMETCQIYDKTTVPDGLGGYVNRRVPGATFKAAIVLDDSIEAQEALSSGTTGVYAITTRKNINLQYHDVFKRLSDGKIFRVKTDGDDKKTPGSASLNMRQVRAEEWSLTEDEQ